MRVVSLLPSATELLAEIGGIDLLVGRSHECDAPPGINHLPILTRQRTSIDATSSEIDRQVRRALSTSNESGSKPSLYELDIARLIELQPEVILTQDLCDVCSIDLNTVRAAAADMSPQPTITSLNPTSAFDVFDDLLTVGSAVNMRREAEAAMVALRGRYWQSIDYVNHYMDEPSIAFIEWMDPLFVGGHWTPELICAAGGRHPLNPAGERSRQIVPEELTESMPDRLIICPCGFDIARTMAELDVLRDSKWWRALPAVNEHRVVIVDGNAMFNRPGPRLVDAMCWLVGWINDRPEIIPDGFPVIELT